MLPASPRPCRCMLRMLGPKAATARAIDGLIPHQRSVWCADTRADEMPHYLNIYRVCIQVGQGDSMTANACKHEKILLCASSLAV